MKCNCMKKPKKRLIISNLTDRLSKKSFKLILIKIRKKFKSLIKYLGNKKKERWQERMSGILHHRDSKAESLIGSKIKLEITFLNWFLKSNRNWQKKIKIMIIRLILKILCSKDFWLWKNKLRVLIKIQLIYKIKWKFKI